MDNIIMIDAPFIQEHTDFNELILVLREYFSNEKILCPPRHHHDFPNPSKNNNTSLLLMPAWNPGSDAGVKMVTVYPNNYQEGYDTIQGLYILFDAKNGSIRSILDAKSLTAIRTAAASALASTFLSKIDAASMLMIGTGTLAPKLIRAHVSVRPIKSVYIWGRNKEKAQIIADLFLHDTFDVIVVETIEEIIEEVDIISCATLSPNPLIRGKYLNNGQHIDLVGSFQRHTREADDIVIKRASVFLDTYQGGLKESGDIVIPLQNGTLRKEDIKADLKELCCKQKQGRISEEEITVFKSVGHSIEDLAAATYYYRKYVNE